MSIIRNFLFHRVHPERDYLWDPMDVQLFEKCIKYISSKFNVVQLEDILQNEMMHSTKSKATIVFDDGYKDNIEYAIPILDKYKVKASFYVVTDCIDKNIPTWTYILDYAFQKTKKSNIEISFSFLPPELHIKELKTKQSRIEYVRKLKPVLKKLKHSQRIQILSSIENSFDDVVLPDIMMDWNDLREIKSAGHYIGSHTKTHSMLGTMDDEEEIKSELLDSAYKIKEQLNYFPKSISFPVGSYNNTTIKISRQVGYELGLAVNQIPYNTKTHNEFEIPRIELYNESWLKTVLRIDSIYGKLVKLIR
ncbi:MAG: polysaccharide deacetylase family protein [Bacteroidia bacterium]